MRVAALIASTGAALVLLVALNWWIDPFGDRYRGDVVARALRHTPSCDVSTSILGDTTWPDYKLDLFDRRRTTAIVVGTSRIWKMGGRPGERFTNLSLPGMAADSVPILFSRLATLAPGRRLTVYLNVDPFWFTAVQRSSSFARVSLHEHLKQLGSAEALRATLSELRKHPLDLVDPPSRQRPDLERSRRGCVLDVDHAVVAGANAWAPNGTFVYNYELTGAAPGHEDFLSGAEGQAMRGRTLASEPLQRIREGLEIAKAHHWRVIGFSAPFSPFTIERMHRNAGMNALLHAFDTGVSALFARARVPFVDLLATPGRVDCTNSDYLREDGAHMTRACAARVRAALDASVPP